MALLEFPTILLWILEYLFDRATIKEAARAVFRSVAAS
jgi:hypothetical protein